MAELSVRLDLRFGTRSLCCLMIVGILFSAVSEVASENVTLTTYYPAPSGVYTQMITTGNTYLARDNGRVGVGTPNPGQLLDVAVPTGSGAGTTANIRASGELISTMSDGVATGQLRMIAGNFGAFFRNDGANTYFLLTNSGNQYGGWNGLRPFMVDDQKGDVSLNGSSLFVRASDGQVGLGTNSPTQTLDVRGNATVSGFFTPNLAVAGAAPGVASYLYVNAEGSACSASAVNNGGCPGQYITWAPGIFQHGGANANGWWNTGPSLIFSTVHTPIGDQTNVTTTAPTYYCCNL